MSKSEQEKNKKWLKSLKDKHKKDKPVVISFKLSSLIGWVGVAAIVVGAYLMGGVMANMQHEQYRHEVLTEAKQIVDSLKSKR